MSMVHEEKEMGMKATKCHKHDTLYKSNFKVKFWHCCSLETWFVINTYKSLGTQKVLDIPKLVE